MKQSQKVETNFDATCPANQFSDHIKVNRNVQILKLLDEKTQLLIVLRRCSDGGSMTCDKAIPSFGHKQRLFLRVRVRVLSNP